MSQRIGVSHDQGVSRPIELQYVLDATAPDGETRRFWKLSRDQAYETADQLRAEGWVCTARDDDYGYRLDLDPTNRR